MCNSRSPSNRGVAKTGCGVSKWSIAPVLGDAMTISPFFATAAAMHFRCSILSMRALETVHAKPRDVVNSPGYRVNFLQQPVPGYAWDLDAYALTEVENVAEVLRWVDENARGRRFEVFAEMDEEPARSFESPRTTGLVRLLGSNPNVGETIEIGHFEKV